MRPSNVKVFSSGHLAVIPIVVASGFIASTALVVITMTPQHAVFNVPCGGHRQINCRQALCLLTEMFQLKDVYRQGNVEFHKDEVSWLYCCSCVR